ncbi:MAG: cell division protein ZapA [Christensenellales bacterium]|jgi:cell division protein ZapA
MEKIKTTVRIGGKEYTISGADSEEFMHRVAIYVDRKMAAIEEANNNLSTTMLAVLTCLNIADELLKLQQNTEESGEQFQEYKSKVETLSKQNEQLQAELSRLQKENILLREARAGSGPAVPPIRR